MPKELEDKLRREANKKGLSEERKNAYIYGTMQHVSDWKPHQGDHTTSINTSRVKK